MSNRTAWLVLTALNILIVFTSCWLLLIGLVLDDSFALVMAGVGTMLAYCALAATDKRYPN